MATGVASAGSGEVAQVTASDLRGALDAAMGAVQADEGAGALLRAVQPRLRLEIPDAGLALNVWTESGGDELRWSFDHEPGFRPRLVLTMDAEVANRYLQGAESLPVAIARGRVDCHCDSLAALRYLPAARALIRHYRRAVRERYPRLARG